jgi:hypothetical protein
MAVTRSGKTPVNRAAIKKTAIKGLPPKKTKPMPGTVGGTNDVGMGSTMGGEADPGSYGHKTVNFSLAPKKKLVKAERGQLAKSMPTKPLTKRQQELAVTQAARNLVDMLRKAH